MAKTALKEADILCSVKEFAEKHIAPRRAELITAQIFPSDLWDSFSKSGLSGLSIPKKFGGSAARYQTLSAAARTLNRYGGVPGATMTFMAHWIFSKLHIAEEVPQAMQRALLPLFARGASTLSVAISEPRAGAHPKLLQTTARKEADHYVINGEKSFLTNGPLADHFIVLAITAEEASQKKFSAILVPASAAGLHRTDSITIDFLHPCPHSGIRLENCQVPVSNLIGIEGDALQRTSLRMRAIEDAAGAAGQIGSMECLLSDLARSAAAERASEIGAIATQLKALGIIAQGLALKADQSENDVQELLELQLGFRQLSGHCCDGLQELLKTAPEPQKTETALLARDIAKFQAIASTAHKARLAKIGKTMLPARETIP